MRNRYSNAAHAAVSRLLLMMLFGTVVLVTTGCEEPDAGDGMVIDVLMDDGTVGIVLPTDTLLNLNCAEVGIFTETCVLEDPENPYLTATIREFDVNNPDAETKFALADDIGVGIVARRAHEAEVVGPAHRDREVLGREIVAAVRLARADNDQRKYAEEILPDRLAGIEIDEPRVRVFAHGTFRCLQCRNASTGPRGAH